MSMQPMRPLSFSFHRHALRVELDADGDPIFHVGDLCAILGHSNPSQAVRQHVAADDLTKREVIDSLGRTQVANFVREPGMWSLILGSATEAAKPVKRWVTAEVLPSIRKTGAYVAPGAQTNHVEVQALRAEVQALRDKVDRLCLSPAGQQSIHGGMDADVAAFVAGKSVTSTGEVLAHVCPGVPVSQGARMRIGLAMQRLGWRRVRVRVEGSLVWQYRRDNNVGR